MPSTYSTKLRLELQASGENETTWGDKTNTNLETVLEAAIAGMATVTLSDANYTLTANFAAADEARNAILYVNGSQTAKRDVICPTATKIYVVVNATTGGQAIRVKTAAGTGIDVQNGETAIVFCDGTNVLEVSSRTKDGELLPAKISGTTQSWRFDDAVGVNRTQPVVAGYGAFGLDGSSGSFVTLFAGGAHVGALLATAAGMTLESAANAITFDIASVEILHLAANGDATFARDLYARHLQLSGTVYATSVNVAAGGFVGLTSANITTALGYTPVQKGTSSSFSPTAPCEIGPAVNPVTLQSYLRYTMSGSGRSGEILTSDATSNYYVKPTHTGTLYFASSTYGTDYASAPLQLREVNYASGGGSNAAPRLALVWSGITAAQVAVNSTGQVTFVDQVGNGYVSTVALHGYFINSVTTGVSDDRLKTRKKKIRGALESVCSLNGFYFTYNRKAKKLGVKDSSLKLGLSAQDMQRVFPELVAPAPCDVTHDIETKSIKSKTGEHYLTVDYEGLVPALVEAIKELKSEIDKLKRQVSAMEKKL